MKPESFKFGHSAFRRTFTLAVQAVVLSWLIVPAAGQEFAGNRQVFVRVRDLRGAPLGPVPVNLRARMGGFNSTAHTQSDGTLAFRGLTAGDYLLEVSVPGYRVAVEEVVLPLAYPNIIPQVFIYLRKESDPDSSAPSSGTPLRDSKAKKEIRKAKEKLQKNDLNGAQKHLERAQKAAPRDTEVHYLLGVLYLRRQLPQAAEEHLKTAIDLYPQHVLALRALSRILYQKGDLPAAIKWLEQALTATGQSADDHMLLADALFQQNQLEKAEFHAQQAVNLSQRRQPDMRLLLCEILLAKGDHTAAEKLLDAYLRDFPAHAGVAVARSVLEKIRQSDRGKPATGSSKALWMGAPGRDLNAHGPSAGLAAASSTATGWAPPDVDANNPAVPHDVPCDLATVLPRVRLGVQDMASNLGDLSADEVISHTDIGENGQPKQSETRHFDYTVSIGAAPSGALLFKEVRNGVFGMEVLGGFSTNAIAVMAMVFHPFYADDFAMRCQGQAIWEGRPVWLVYFSQQPGRPARIHSFRSRMGSFQIPLKGRAWVTANSFEIVRLETAMVAPIPEARLEREQMIIEYRPVRFEQRKRTFWLPLSADIYMEYRGKRWHRRHVLQNYVHFAVDTQQKISTPQVPDS